MTINEAQDEIIGEFSVFDDWLDKYDYLIELSDALPPIDAAHRTDRYLINGFDQMTEGNPFFSFVITLSGHGPYGEDNPSYQAHAEAAQAAAQRTDGNYVYAVAGAMETDQFIGELVDSLTQLQPGVNLLHIRRLSRLNDENGDGAVTLGVFP